jgi:hypothetical protein
MNPCYVDGTYNVNGVRLFWREDHNVVICGFACEAIERGLLLSTLVGVEACTVEKEPDVSVRTAVP